MSAITTLTQIHFFFPIFLSWNEQDVCNILISWILYAYCKYNAFHRLCDIAYSQKAYFALGSLWHTTDIHFLYFVSLYPLTRKFGLPPPGKRVVTGAFRCSPVPMFPRPYVPPSPCSPVPMFPLQKRLLPRAYVSPSWCSLIKMFPNQDVSSRVPMFPRPDVSPFQCSPVPSRCSPVPLFLQQSMLCVKQDTERPEDATVSEKRYSVFQNCNWPQWPWP